MPAQKYIRNDAGSLKETSASQTSTGVADAGKIVALDDYGKLDSTMLPTGFGDDVALIQASENLSAGEWVNVWNNTGAFRARKADATVEGKETHGFVLENVTSGQNARVFFEGTNNQVTGQTPGRVFLATTAGQGSATAPTGSGNIVQIIGFATSATTVNFQYNQPIVLA